MQRKKPKDQKKSKLMKNSDNGFSCEELRTAIIHKDFAKVSKFTKYIQFVKWSEYYDFLQSALPNPELIKNRSYHFGIVKAIILASPERHLVCVDPDRFKQKSLDLLLDILNYQQIDMLKIIKADPLKNQYIDLMKLTTDKILKDQIHALGVPFDWNATSHLAGSFFQAPKKMSDKKDEEPTVIKNVKKFIDAYNEKYSLRNNFNITTPSERLAQLACDLDTVLYMPIYAKKPDMADLVYKIQELLFDFFQDNKKLSAIESRSNLDFLYLYKVIDMSTAYLNNYMRRL